MNKKIMLLKDEHIYNSTVLHIHNLKEFDIFFCELCGYLIYVLKVL